MSSITSALTYKLQKMEKTLSSLMEENAKLKSIINEANYAGMTPTQAFQAGGGAALGAQLAAQPQLGVGGMGKVAVGVSPTSTSMPGGLKPSGMGSAAPSAPATTQAMRSLTPTVGGVNAQAFDGAYLGQLLATGDMRAVTAYLSQFAAQPSGVQSAAPTAAPTATQMRQIGR
jgi:hypothetical protein